MCIKNDLTILIDSKTFKVGDLAIYDDECVMSLIGRITAITEQYVWFKDVTLEIKYKINVKIKHFKKMNKDLDLEKEKEHIRLVLPLFLSLKKSHKSHYSKDRYEKKKEINNK